MVAAYWEREQAREGLEELAKAKDRFIATVSHELRTPLSAVARQLARMMGGDLVYRRRSGWTCFELALLSVAIPEMAVAVTG